MIISNDTQTTIQVLLDAPEATAELPCLAVWSDMPSGSMATGKTATVTSGATPVTLVPAIEETNRRQLKYLSVYNADTAAATVTVRLDINGTATTLIKVTLQIGYVLLYNEGSGWQVLTSAGVPPATGSGTYLEVANNLSDVANAATSFSNIKQAATESATGAAEIATQAETNTGTDDQRIVTPLKLQTRMAAYAQPLDSDLTTIAGLTPSNDDIIQRKAGAWANRTIAQLYTDLQASVKNDVYFQILVAGANAQSPADATTYYMGAAVGALSTTANARKIIPPVSCELVAAFISAINTATVATSEASSLYIRKNNTTDTLLSSAVAFNGALPAQNTYVVTGLSVAFNGTTDSFEIKWDTPTWVTNPTGAVPYINLYFKRT